MKVDRTTLAKEILGEGNYDIKTGKGYQEIYLSSSQFIRVEEYLEKSKAEKSGGDDVMVYDFGDGRVHFVRALSKLQIHDLNPKKCKGLLKAIKGDN